MYFIVRGPIAPRCAAFVICRSGALAIALLTGYASDALAVPAFAEQTGQRCSACHVGGLGPQLTPFGRQFKLGGYTMRAGSAFTNPFAGMIVASYVNTQKDQEPATPHYDSNDNFTLDQASLFVAGGVGEHFGAFSQFTYDGVGRSFAWDQLDLRATTRETIAGTSTLFGISLNNSPGVQDVWNTLPSWGFPYTSSALAPSPATGTVISGALAQRVLGATVYAMWDAHFYTEAGLYWAPGRKTMSALGVDLRDGDAVLKGGAPYFRAAYQEDYGNQNFELGAFALFTHLYPGGDTSVSADKFTDIGIDASWQYMSTMGNTFQFNARYTHEQQNLASSFPLGISANGRDTLDEVHVDASYYWHKIIGATISPFDIWGSRDPLLYADNVSMTPNSMGVIFQLDYTPWGTDISPLGPRFNVRVGAQYTVYSRFNGSGTNYDGQGHNASDNNTFRLFTWFEF
jgi:hypothetical protein